MKIYVKNTDNLTLPMQGSNVSAGYDIVATSDPKIVGTPNVDIPEQWDEVDYIQYETNLFVAPETLTHHILIHPRSSISKYNLVLANSIGLVDNDYRGMIMCRFKYIWQPKDWNDGPGKINMEKIYQKGDRIAQLVVEPTISVTWDVVTELPDTDRGSGGFGSTGIQSPPVEMLETTHPAVKVPKYVQDIAGLYKDATEGIPNRKTYSELMRERNMEG